jgi:hypothetical protein
MEGRIAIEKWDRLCVVLKQRKANSRSLLAISYQNPTQKSMRCKPDSVLVHFICFVECFSLRITSGGRGLYLNGCYSAPDCCCA